MSTALEAVADRLDALQLEAGRWIAVDGGIDEHGSSVGGWINNPFRLKLAQLAVDLRDALAEDGS